MNGLEELCVVVGGGFAVQSVVVVFNRHSILFLLQFCSLLLRDFRNFQGKV